MWNVSWSVCCCYVFLFLNLFELDIFLYQNWSWSFLVYLNLLYFYFRSADATVRMFDRRNLTSGDVGSPVHKFEGHSAAVLCVQVTENFWPYFLDSILRLSFHYICRNMAYLVYCYFLPKLCFCYQWSPDKSSVFGSSAEDGILNIWDHEKVWSYKFYSILALLSLPLSLSCAHAIINHHTDERWETKEPTMLLWKPIEIWFSDSYWGKFSFLLW